MMPFALAAAVTATNAIAFAPPLDTPLRYDIIEYRPGPGGALRHTLREEVRFSRDGDGYLLTMRALSLTLSAPKDRRALLDATMKAIIDRPVRIHLSRGGVPERMIGGAELWADFVAAMRGRAAKTHDAATARMADRFAALPPQQRDAQLMGNADYIVAPHMPPLAIGQIVADGATTTARHADAAGTRRFHRTSLRPAPGGTAGKLSIEEDVALAHDTGLVVRRATMTRLLPDPAGAPVFVGRSETLMVK
jgi:hypothetical protein